MTIFDDKVSLSQAQDSHSPPNCSQHCCLGGFAPRPPTEGQAPLYSPLPVPMKVKLNTMYVQVLPTSFEEQAPLACWSVLVWWASPTTTVLTNAVVQ